MRGWFIVHPRIAKISRFSDGHLEGREEARVRRHLERCTRCRKTLSRLRETDRVLAALPTPQAPPELIDAVFARRDADIRTILPQTTGLGSHRSRTGALAGIGAATAGGVLLASLVVGGVRADSNRLLVDGPAPDGTTDMVYWPAPHLEDVRTLRARVRAWFRDETREPVTFTRSLRRDGNGFVGTIRLPEGAAYGQVVVEDRYGTRIDIGQGQVWEVWNDPPARRDLGALLTELRASEELRVAGFISSADLGFRARELTSAFPASVEAWARRAYYDLATPGGGAEPESSLQLHLARFTEFIVGVEREDDPDRLVSLIDYAQLLGDRAAAERLSRLLTAVDPDSPLLRELGLERAQVELRDAPRGMLDFLERDWQAHDQPNKLAAYLGFRIARDVADPELAVRWGRRLYALDPDSRDGIARQLALIPDAEGESTALLRERLRDAEALGDRPLYQSVSEFEAVRNRRRAQLLGALGVALLGSGADGAGVDVLEESLALGWDADVARTIVGHYEARGLETDRVLDLRATLVADPLTEVSGDDAITSSRLERARESLIRQLLAGLPVELVHDRLPDVLDHSRVALITLWRMVPDRTHPLYERFAGAAERVREAGGQAFVAAPEDGAEKLREFASGFAVLDDGERVIEDLRGWNARSYAVFHDGSYSLHHELEDALRLALLLSDQTR